MSDVSDVSDEGDGNDPAASAAETSAADTALQDSNPNAAGPARAAGAMGVSSERVGPTGPGQESTDGERDTRWAGTSGDPGLDEADTPPEQSPGNPEQNSETIPPVAGYPSKNPRSDA